MRRFGWLLAIVLLGVVSTVPACADDDYGQGPDAAQTRDLSVGDLASTDSD